MYKGKFFSHFYDEMILLSWIFFLFLICKFIPSFFSPLHDKGAICYVFNVSYSLIQPESS